MATIIVLMWILLFPFGQLVLVYPADHPLITLDRAMIALLAISALCTAKRRRLPLTKEIRVTVAFWLVFVVTVIISLIDPFLGQESLFAARVMIDSFVLPLFLAWFVIRDLDVARCMRALHLSTSIMIIYNAGIAVFEVITKTEILREQRNAATVLRAGVSWNALVRPSGPFSQPYILALVGLMSLLFLAFLRNGGVRFSILQEFIHKVAVCGCFVCIAVPLFRMILFATAVIIIWDIRRALLFKKRRLMHLAVLSLFLGSAVALKTLNPDAYSDRADPTNIVGRISEDALALRIAVARPLTGVGFGEYHAAAEYFLATAPEIGGVRPAGNAHNNIAFILGECGLIAALAYILSQWCLFKAFAGKNSQIRRLNGPAARVFVYVFTAYTFCSFSEGSIYDSICSMWFVFIAACVYKYVISRPAPVRQELASVYRPRMVAATAS